MASPYDGAHIKWRANDGHHGIDYMPDVIIRRLLRTGAGPVKKRGHQRLTQPLENLSDMQSSAQCSRSSRFTPTNGGADRKIRTFVLLQPASVSSCYFYHGITDDIEFHCTCKLSQDAPLRACRRDSRISPKSSISKTSTCLGTLNL